MDWKKFFSFSLTLLFALFFTSLVWAQNKVQIQVNRLEVVGENQAIKVEGQASLRDGTVLSLSLRFHDEVGVWKKVDVTSGTFRGQISIPKGKIIPGEYTVRAEFFPRLQRRRVYPRIPKALEVEGGSKKVYLGDKDKEKEEIKKIKSYLLGVMDRMRRVFHNLVQEGGYHLANIKISQIENGGVVKQRVRSSILKNWRKFYRRSWQRFLRTARYDFKRYQKMRFLSPFPKAENNITNIFDLLYKLYASYTIRIHKHLKRPLPSHLKFKKMFNPETLKKQIHELAKGAYKNLGKKKMDWAMITPTGKEEGNLSEDGNTYKSRTSKFKITKPDDWLWDFTVTNPSMRLRIRPGNKEMRKLTAVAVEIYDYPQAEDFKHLEKLTRFRARGRYQGFKKIKGKSIKAPDPEMPKGVRPGYLLILESKDDSGHFVVYQYELFCRWHKRTYGVVCIVNKKEYDKNEKKFKKIFEKICQSFRILDHPDLKEDEEKEKEEK